MDCDSYLWYIWINCFILPDELSVCVCSHALLAWGHATSSFGPFPMPVSCSALDLTYSSSCPLPLLTIKWNVVLYQCFACYVYDIAYFFKFVDSPAHPQLLILIQLIIFLFLFQIFLNKSFSFNYALWFNKKSVQQYQINFMLELNQKLTSGSRSKTYGFQFSIR